MTLPDDSHFEASTPDVTLTYLLWLDLARNNRWLQLAHDVRCLYRMALWDYGEDGSCYHFYHTQHEASTDRSHQYPASHDRRTRYYDVDTLPLHRPEQSNYKKFDFSYPLAHTRRIFTCTTCGGSGQVTCGRCSGSGRCGNCSGRGKNSCSSCSGGGRCSSCGGSGRSGENRCYSCSGGGRCGSCSGSGTRTCNSCSGSGRCSNCGGSGKVTCPTCEGEGQLLAYVSRDYKWWHDTDEETILTANVDRRDVRKLVARVRQKGGSVRIESFTQAEIVRTTAVFNPRIQELLQLAEQKRTTLEAAIRGRSNLILFQDIQREYMPLLYINLFVGRRYEQCFVAGTTLKQDIHLKIPLSLPKCGAWCSLVAFVALAASGMAPPALLGTVFLLLASFTGFSIRQIAELRSLQRPARWLVLDDRAGRAWQFVYLYAQAISRNKSARITDPWFTTLLEPPIADSVQGRNSFLFTIEDLGLKAERQNSDVTPLEQSEANLTPNVASEASQLENSSANSASSRGPQKPRDKTEMLVIGWRAQQKLAQDMLGLAAEAHRTILLVSGENAGIRAHIDALASHRSNPLSPPLHLIFVRDSDERIPIDWEPVQIASSYPQAKLEFLDLPLARMCEEVRTGTVSTESATAYDVLLTLGGYVRTEAVVTDRELAAYWEAPLLAATETNSLAEQENTQ